MSRYLVPLLIGGRVVAYWSEAAVLDLRDRLRARGIAASVPEACAGCGRRHRSTVVEGPTERETDYRWLLPACAPLCSRCRRRAAGGKLLPIDYEREAERRGGAEPEEKHEQPGHLP